jgi:hypothetical protein
MMEDKESKIQYQVGEPSDEYLILLLIRILEPKDIRRPYFRLNRYLNGPYGHKPDEKITDLFQALKIILSSYQTVRIKSDKHRTIDQFSSLSSSFLFHIAYNLDSSFIEITSLDSFKNIGRITRNRRAKKIEDIEPPRKIYDRNLCYRYQMGVDSENPVLKFLSFYQVIEHYFEDVYKADLIKRVKEKITRPDFSYRRDKDVEELIKDISKQLKLKSENSIINESEALKLVIKQYVDLSTVVSHIETYDINLVDHYSSQNVDFSDGDAVDLKGKDRLAVIDSLTTRIYKTRNAIVHGKEGDRKKYTPFKDEASLAKEVPLIRFLAEEVIINTSKELK